MGTDTMSAVLHIMDAYDTDEIFGFSIPASEHSTITSWLRAAEEAAYRNMLKSFGREGSVLAVVSDSYDIYNACKLWGTNLKDDVIKSGATLVIRPDSGDPIEVIPKMLKILDKYFSSTVNAKGYKVLNHVRIIWGDGINNVSLASILRTVVDVCGYSADNIGFGMGGGLLQQCDRDTLKFAMKCSAIGIREPAPGFLNGALTWRDVFKDPITDPGKASKKGRVTLFKTENGKEYYTGVEDWRKDELETYYENGEQVFKQTFHEVRANSRL
jgi:nicotinamide phosphoribosyltransferase